MTSDLLQRALLAHAESQTDAGQRRAAARNRLDSAARHIALCTAERILGLAVASDSVIVGIEPDPTFALPHDEGLRVGLVEFSVEVELGLIIFAIKPNGFNGEWRPDNANLFIRGPRHTSYAFFRVRNLADLGEYVQAVLTPKGGK